MMTEEQWKQRFSVELQRWIRFGKNEESIKQDANKWFNKKRLDGRTSLEAANLSINYVSPEEVAKICYWMDWRID